MLELILAELADRSIYSAACHEGFKWKVFSVGLHRMFLQSYGKAVGIE
jgi:hypothetical protein